MKKLIILACFILLLPVFAMANERSFPTEPEKDKLVRMLVIYLKEEWVLISQYKIHEDTENIDYQTVRPLRRRGPFLVGDKFPSGYWYDLNRDGEFSEDEMLIDLAKDGMNGNELTYEEYERKKDTSGIFKKLKI